MPHTRIYLAGPFFNSAQLAFIEQAEEALRASGVSFFSPRLQHADERVEITSDEQAAQVFDMNKREIYDCTHLLAVLDYQLPDDLTLAVFDRPAKRVLREVAVPDTGTVWEMGYAHALARPIYALVDQTPHTLNLMLTRCCEGMVRINNLGAFAGSLGLSPTNPMCAERIEVKEI